MTRPTIYSHDSLSLLLALDCPPQLSDALAERNNVVKTLLVTIPRLFLCLRGIFLFLVLPLLEVFC